MSFNIILNSGNYLEGNSSADCIYNIDLKQLLDYDDKNYKKKYRIKWSLTSPTLSPSIKNLYGLFIYGLSNDIKNGTSNFNNDYYNFFGVLKPKLYKNIYKLEAKYDDNEPIILDGLNNTSQVRVQIKSLTSTPLTTLEDGLIWNYKFQKDDFNGTSLYDHISKTFIANVLKNGATYTTINPKIGNACLDLTKTTNAYIALPTINFSTTYSNTPLTIAFWYKANTDASIYNLFNDYRDGRYFLYGTGNNINLFVDFLPTETIFQTYYNNILSISVNYTGLGDTTNNGWIHLVWVFGNTSTHKLYLNGNFISSVTNTQTLTTNYTPNFGQNYLQSFLRGYASDMRFYGKELTANEVLSLYELGNICYNMTLNIEET